MSLSKKILIEGLNLMLPKGTGIATYAHHLADVVKASGYRMDLVFGTRRKLPKLLGEAGEVPIFDALSDLPQTLVSEVIGYLGDFVGLPLGSRPTPLKLSGLVVDPRVKALSKFEHLYPITRLPDVAKQHFKRYGSCVSVSVQDRPSLFHATCPIPLAVKGCPNIYTIHDLVPIRLPQATLDDKAYMYKMLRHIAQRADHIVTVSDYSRQDIIRFLGVAEDRVTNTYQAVSFPAHHLNKPTDVVSREIGAAFGLDYKDYFVFVGAIEPKKNVSRLIDAYLSSGSKRPLIVIGAAAWQFETELKKIQNEKFSAFILEGKEIRPRARVRHLEYLPRSQVINLVRGARAMLFPSLYEGFGLPVVEAMLLGTAVLTSNISCLPEIAGGAALLVDPYEVEEMSAAIHALDQDQGLVDDLSAKGLIRAKAFDMPSYTGRVATLYSKFVQA